MSLPYSAIKAFELTTAGMVDFDAELEFWTDMPWMPRFAADLQKGFDLKNVMQVLGTQLVNVDKPKSLLDAGRPGGIINWFRGAVSERNLTDAEEKFHTDPAILLDDENVQFVGEVGRDTLLFTSDRALEVDVKGITGKRVRYTSVLYRSVGSFMVCKAGKTDLDADVRLETLARGLSSLNRRLSRSDNVYNISSLLTAGVMQAHA